MSLKQLQSTYPWRNLQSFKVDGDTTYVVWIVNFHDMLLNHRNDILVNSFVTHEVFHAAVGLVDVCLPDMETELIYSKLAEKKAYTILVFRDRSETVAAVTKRLEKRRREREALEAKGDAAPEKPKARRRGRVKSTSEEEGAKKPSSHGDGKLTEEKEEEEDEEEMTGDEILLSGQLDVPDEKDVYDGDEEDENKFRFVYTDSEPESKSSEGEEDSDEDTNSKGYHKFLKTCLLRKRRQRELIENGRAKDMRDTGSDALGPSDLLAGCACFQDRLIARDLERIIHITFLSVRRRQRKTGLGQYLLALMKDRLVVGDYKAVVVHADNSAVEFFRKYDFFSDSTLNKQWDELADEFTNCTLMCYLPPFGKRFNDFCIPSEENICNKAVQNEMEKWKVKTEEVYTSQMTLFIRFNQEIQRLQNIVCSQDELIKHLMTEVRTLSRERVRALGEAAGRLEITEQADGKGSGDRGHDFAVRVGILRKAKEEVQETMNRRSILTGGLVPSSELRLVFRVTHVIPAMLDLSPPATVQFLHKHPEAAKQPPLCLYYCGSRDNVSRLHDIVREGFTVRDLKDGEYGRGLYFAKDPRLAAVYSFAGRLLLVHLYAGRVLQVEAKARSRTLTCGPDHESVQCPGRLRLEKDCGFDLEEFVVYDARQAVPLGLIEYEEEGDEEEEEEEEEEVEEEEEEPH